MIEPFTKELENKIDKLDRQIEVLDQKKSKLEREKAWLLMGQSPIQAGDTIEWVTGSCSKNERTKRGLVVRDNSNYRGFEYRVNILDSKGVCIGFATINSEHHPTLLKKAKPTKKRLAVL